MPVLATRARKLPRVITCSNCGEGNPERARFCLRCGSSLTGASTPDEERMEPLRRARAILSLLGERPLLEEIDDLLGEEPALTS